MSPAIANLFASLAYILCFCGCSKPARSIQAPEAKEVARVIDGVEVAKPWLADTARSASSAGAGALQVVAYGSGGPGDSVDGFLFIPAGSCALIFARGSSRITDLDLHAFDDLGAQIGLDEAPDDLPTILLCPKQSKRVYVAAKVASGQGVLAVGLQAFSAKHAESVRRAVGARSVPTQSSEVTEAWPGLEQIIYEHRWRIGGNWADQRRVALPVDARVPTRLTAVVPAEGCLDILALSEDPNIPLTMTASDQSGRIFARAERRAESSSLVLCSPISDRSVTLTIRPRLGQGLAVAILSVLKGPEKRLDLNPQAPLHILGAPGEVSANSTELPRPSKKRKVLLELAGMKSEMIQMQGCARLELMPNDHLQGLSAKIWNREGHLIAEAHPAWQAPLFFCSKTSVRFDSLALIRSGTLRWQLRSTNKIPAAFFQAPLAASRLMTRAHVLGRLTMPGDIKKVTFARLSAEHLSRHQFTVPAGSCRDVFAARGPDGYGLEARLFVSKTGLELDHSQAAESLALQACAPADESLKLTLELRSIRGRCNALWYSLPNER